MDMHWIVGLGPFLVPLGGMAVAIVAIIAGNLSEQQKRRLAAEERIALINRGMPLPDIDRVSHKSGETVKDPMRSLANARRAAVVLISVGVGMILFFAGIAAAVGEREVLSGSAIGLIPLAIGVGFLFDYNLQKRELSRFGMEIGIDKTPTDLHG